MNKLKQYLYGGDWLLAMSAGLVVLLFLMAVTKEPSPEPLPKVQETILEDGTKCVVVKGFYSYNAITCDWSK